MPISVGFLLAPLKKGKSYSNPHPLQLRMTIDGKEDSRIGAVWPLDGTGTKIKVDPAKWNVTAQATSTRDDPANRSIVQLHAHILTVYAEQKKTAPPTAGSIRYQLREAVMPAYSKGKWLLESEVETEQPPQRTLSEESPLTDAYITWIIDLKLKAGPSPDRTQQIHIGRWERGLFLLQEWERQKSQPVPLCYRVTLSWLNEYHFWLTKQKSDKQAKPISGPMASRYIGKIGKVLQWLVEDELLTHNSVKKKTWPRYDDKEINFLEPEHIARLFTLHWKGTKASALWWFLLMCCTGLDFPDAVLYASDRPLLERTGPAGLKLVGKRMKPPHEEYNVPVLDEVLWLFAVFPNGAARISAECVNRYTDQIEGILGITWRITNKTARKTFGCLMLINGYYIGEVSRMLGHKRISTTEQHYAKIIGTAVDRGRIRVGKSSLL